MDASNTGENRPTNKGQFKKGDVRINRKGRPRSFDALRRLAQSIAHEPAKTAEGDEIVIDEHIATRAEMILREWAADPKHQKDFMEIGFGKVPDDVNVNQSGALTIRIVDEADNA